MRISINNKYSILFSFCLAAVVLLLAIGSLKTYRHTISIIKNSIEQNSSEKLMEQITKRSETLVNILAEETLNPLYYYDLESIYRILESVRKQPNVISTFILDEGCKVIHDGTEEIVLFNHQYGNRSHCQRQSEDLTVLSTREENSVISSKQLIFGEEIIGNIMVEISLEETKQYIENLEQLLRQTEASGHEKFLLTIIFLSLFLLLCALIIARMLSSWLTKPIDELRRHATRIGKGDYSQELLSKRNDEVGDLINEFEQMRYNLSVSTVSLEKLKREIEEKEQAEKARKTMESQLRQSQRMEGVGQLAAGIAHDLNNILSGIVTLPQLLLIDLPEDSDLRKPLERIEQSGNQAAMIVQDMLTLSKSSSVGVVLDPLAVVNKFLESPECTKLKDTHPGVEVKTRFNGDMKNIVCSPVHLVKVLMNLVINAADSIPEKGEIVVSAECVKADRPFGVYQVIPEGEFVCISVIDTGVGIASEDIQQVFEPFYTKKVLGRSGTGLGMVIVWNTMRDYNGYIDIESSIGVGTSVRLYFPATSDVTASVIEVNRDLSAIRGNRQSILVVDDIEAQREIATTILETLNYQVVSVPGGQDAIDYLAQQTVDLIILDMIMPPGIDGLETCKRILSQNSNACIIIASGYSESGMVNKALEVGAKRFIQKPYSISTLGGIVKETFKLID